MNAARGLGWCLLAAAIAWCAPARAEDREEARRHFAAGVAYLEDPDEARYEDAYREFQRAYQLSGSPTVLGNLGLCAMKLERDGEAIADFERYLAEVDDIDPDERVQCARDLETLRAGAARVRIAVPEWGGASIVDRRTPVRGAPIANVYAVASRETDLVLRPGRHVLSLVREGRELATWQVDAAPGTPLEHTFEPPQAPTSPPARRSAAPPPPTPRVAPLVVVGAGAAALAAGAVLGAVTLGKVSGVERECPHDTCSPRGLSDVEAARGWVRATDAFLVGGGVVTIAGVGWLVASSPRSGRAAAGAACAPRRCVATVRVGF